MSDPFEQILSNISKMTHKEAHEIWDFANRSWVAGLMNYERYERLANRAKERMEEIKQSEDIGQKKS